MTDGIARAIYGLGFSVSATAVTGALSRPTLPPRRARTDVGTFLGTLSVPVDFGCPGPDLTTSTNPATSTTGVAPNAKTWRAYRKAETHSSADNGDPLIHSEAWWTGDRRPGKPAVTLRLRRRPDHSFTTELQEVFEPRALTTPNDLEYRQGQELGRGSYGRVYKFDAQTPAEASTAHDAKAEEAVPGSFAVKFVMLQGSSQWTELDVLRELALCRGLMLGQDGGATHDDAVLTARLVEPPVRVVRNIQLAAVLMERADGPLDKHAGKLGYRDAVALTRAAFNDLARYWEATRALPRGDQNIDRSLIHMDVKAANFLYAHFAPQGSASGAAASGDTCSGTLHVLAADFGSFVRPDMRSLSTYISPAHGADRHPGTDWSITAFGLGATCIELLDLGTTAPPHGGGNMNLKKWLLCAFGDQDPKKRRTPEFQIGIAEAWRGLCGHMQMAQKDGQQLFPRHFQNLLNGLLGFDPREGVFRFPPPADVGGGNGGSVHGIRRIFEAFEKEEKRPAEWATFLEFVRS